MKDFMEPIIRAYYSQLESQIEGEVYKATQKIGIDVDKDRLVQALTDASKFWDEGYEAGRRNQPRWISVEERLPEGGGSVLIYSPFGGVAEGTYSEHYKRWVQYRWSVFEPEVTHWMPLPMPPKEEV